MSTSLLYHGFGIVGYNYVRTDYRAGNVIFTELQLRYPGRYKKGQLRTLQRHVKAWRSEALLTFDYAWINDEILVNEKFINKFQGKITREATF